MHFQQVALQDSIFMHLQSLGVMYVERRGLPYSIAKYDTVMHDCGQHTVWVNAPHAGMHDDCMLYMR